MDSSNEHARPHTVAAPTAAASDRAIADARRLFDRTLCGWASDLLAVRAEGLSGYSWSAEHAELVWNRAA